MAAKNAIRQPPKKETIKSTSEGPTKASIVHGDRSASVMTRSTTKATASITLKQQVEISTLQSRKTKKI